jgi:hypothetical protein
MKSWFRSEERLFRLEDEGLDQTADNQNRPVIRNRRIWTCPGKVENFS